MPRVSSFAHSGPRIARWSLVILLNVVILLFVGVSTIRESYQAWQVDQEIQQMRDQVQVLEGKKMQLTELIQRLNSPEALDQEARARLGLRKPDERVLVVQNDGLATAAPGAGQAAAAPSPERSNAQKWFEYFFHS